MDKRKLKVLLLTDVSETPPANQDFKKWFAAEDWSHETRLIRVLKEQGHEVKFFGLYDNIRDLLDYLREYPPDLVFNQCEAIYGNRGFESHVTSLFDVLGLPYTGAGPEAMLLCKDKALTKKILTYHGIRVPAFVVSERSQPLRRLESIGFPVFVKPLALEGSEGITRASFADSEKDALERIARIHEKYGCDAIVEEYIAGRELYVGVMGNEEVTVLPARELYFGPKDGEPAFATFKAKWDDSYRARRGIHNRMARFIPTKSVEKIERVSREIYRLLKIRGFGRIDFRLTADGEPVFLEANPNPSLVREEDFALAAEKRGLTYSDLIERILELGLEAPLLREGSKIA